MNMDALSQTALFQGSTPQDTEAMLSCLGAERRQYPRGAVILRAGEAAHSLGLVLSGSVLIEHDDFWGNATVLDSVGPGQVFAESYACTPGEALMVHVSAAEASEILFLNTARVLQTCPHACPCHGLLIRNLLTLSAQKNLRLSRKIFHTAPKTIRGRLLLYLSDQALRAGGQEFTIPFNRQQLADYLNVDRSALSSELGKMQREGLLEVSRNRFRLGDRCHPEGR